MDCRFLYNDKFLQDMIKILSEESEFHQTLFKDEAELETVVVQNYAHVFGQNTYYFNLKKGIRHKKGDLLTIPDGVSVKIGRQSNYDNY